MKRNLLFLYSLLLALIPLGSVAQTATNDVLTFTTSKAVGETIQISLQYQGQLKVEGLESVPPSAPFELSISTVKLTAQTVTIKGQLLHLAIYNDQKITSLSAPNHTTLERLQCVNNPSLTSLNLSGCNKLNYISILGTGLKDTHLTQFIGSLPKVKEGKLNFYNAYQKATHAYWTIQDIRDANAKGWHVTTLVGHDNVELYPDEITIGVDPAVSEVLSLWIIGEGENIPLISNIEGNPVIESGDKFTPYTVTQKSVVIGGNVKLFKVEELKNITSINLGKNRSLTHLVCTKGKVKELGLSECSSLNLVECYGNGMRGEATTRLMSTLPDRTSAKEPGKIYFVDEASSEAQKNSYSDTDLFLAKNRGWVVYRRLSSGKFEEIKPTGTSYDQITFTTAKKVGEGFFILTNPSKPISVRGLKLLSQSESTPDKNAIVTAQDITLVGNVLSLVLADQQITAFESKDNKELRSLVISGNKLTKLDLSTFEKLESVVCFDNPFDKEGSAFTLSHLPNRTKEETPGAISFVSTAKGDLTPTYSSAAIAAANALNWKVMQRDHEGNESEIVPKINVITLVTDKAVGSEVTIEAKLADALPVKVTGLSVAEITAANAAGKFTLTAQTVTLTGDIISLSLPDGEWTKIETTTDYDNLESLAYPRNKVVAPVLNTPRLSMLDCRNNGMSEAEVKALIATLPNLSNESAQMSERKGTLLIADEANDTHANVCPDEAILAAQTKNWESTVHLGGEVRGKLFTSDKNTLRFETKLPMKSKVRFTLHYAGTLLAADGLSTQDYLPESSDSEQECELTATFVRLVGDVDQLNITAQQVTRLALPGHKSIAKIDCADNAITTFDLAGCAKLLFLNMTKNGLTAELVSQLIAQLPDRSAETDKGELRLFNTYKGAGETNEITAEHLKAAKAKGWRITDSKAEITEQQVATDLVLRPDSTDDTVYTLEGIRLFIPANELPEGIYIIGGKKVIINRTK
ncbi:leucine Rich Repeat protein [Porphyromonas uenonis 60-3]|uniref:Leucine Rich Repeat protein n=1 Tax=Porphyromonas uenonis 60-3 TaxID=596327 RepID=C2MAE2_9PORP|nr:hypothetical protein [Porphyromonas uenonis]EEK17319.1 leucine Rich Repeat protein [Porphyromonas uenonis 60-3]